MLNAKCDGYHFGKSVLGLQPYYGHTSFSVAKSGSVKPHAPIDRAETVDMSKRSLVSATYK